MRLTRNTGVDLVGVSEADAGDLVTCECAIVEAAALSEAVSIWAKKKARANDGSEGVKGCRTTLRDGDVPCVAWKLCPCAERGRNECEMFVLDARQ